MKKITIGLGVLALVMGLAGLSASTVLAYRGDPSVKGPNYSAERHESMTAAFENKDYAAWKSLMQGRGRVSQIINQDNFAKFAEAHQLALDGKTSEAQKIRQELGLGLNNGSCGRQGGMGVGRGLRR